MKGKEIVSRLLRAKMAQRLKPRVRCSPYEWSGQRYRLSLANKREGRIRVSH